jgi:hypothetical protein
VPTRIWRRQSKITFGSSGSHFACETLYGRRVNKLA